MQAMRHFITVILCSALLTGILCFSFRKTNENSNLLAGLEVLSPIVSGIDTVDKFKSVISQMEQEDEVRWTESFTGEKSSQQKRFEWLTRFASVDQLTKLLENKYPHMRVYAFLCLKNRNNIDLKSLVLKHLNDNSFFKESQGCFGDIEIINHYFLEETTGRFSKTELAKYRKIVANCNKNMTSFNSN